MTRLLYIAAALLLATAAGCDLQKPSEKMLERGEGPSKGATPGAEGEEEPVAIVNGEVITHAEFRRRIQQLAPFARARLSSQEKRKEFLNSVVDFEVLADEAEQRGYGDDPAVIQAMKDVMVRKMIQEEVRERVSMTDVTEEEVEDYYRKHRSKYRQPERRRVVLLLADTKEEAQKIREALLEKQPDSVDERVTEFRTYSAQLSTDRAAARKGGDVGWIDHPDGRPERIKLSREVFALEQRGDITEPFRLRDEWALATFIDKRSASDKPLDEVEQSIRETLYDQKKKKTRDAFITEIREKARVERYEDVIESAEAPTADEAPEVGEIPTIPIRDLRGERGAEQEDDSKDKKN